MFSNGAELVDLETMEYKYVVNNDSMIAISFDIAEPLGHRSCYSLLAPVCAGTPGIYYLYYLGRSSAYPLLSGPLYISLAPNTYSYTLTTSMIIIFAILAWRSHSLERRAGRPFISLK